MEYNIHLNFKKFPTTTAVCFLSEEDMNHLRNMDCEWCVTEKIDGANIQIVLSKDGYCFCSRNQKLGEGSEFYNISRMFPEQVYKKLAAFVSSLKEKGTETVFHLYGEWYGNQVIDRIPYSKKYDLRLFALGREENGEVFWDSFSEFSDFLNDIGLKEFSVPLLSCCATLDAALAFDTEFKASYISEKNDDVSEGIVIQPFRYNTTEKETRRIALKKKNKSFLEKDSKKFSCVVREGMEEEVESLKNEFLSLCNENRMISVFSKLGKPEDMKSCGMYIKEFLSDAYADFLLEHPDLEERLTEKEQKHVLNIGSTGFLILKKLMNIKDKE